MPYSSESGRINEISIRSKRILIGSTDIDGNIVFGRVESGRIVVLQRQTLDSSGTGNLIGSDNLLCVAVVIISIDRDGVLRTGGVTGNFNVTTIRAGCHKGDTYTPTTLVGGGADGLHINIIGGVGIQTSNLFGCSGTSNFGSLHVGIKAVYTIFQRPNGGIANLGPADLSGAVGHIASQNIHRLDACRSGESIGRSGIACHAPRTLVKLRCCSTCGLYIYIISSTSHKACQLCRRSSATLNSEFSVIASCRSSRIEVGSSITHSPILRHITRLTPSEGGSVVSDIACAVTCFSKNRSLTVRDKRSNKVVFHHTTIGARADSIYINVITGLSSKVGEGVGSGRDGADGGTGRCGIETLGTPDDAIGRISLTIDIGEGQRGSVFGLC